MALKNLFDMVKADRYTQDGRDELIKAQEKETEDKVYQIGEISQKTGLQKTANGWVKPKGGKQPGVKKEGSHPTAGATNGDKWQKNTDYLGRERISMETPQGGKVSIYESSNPKQKNARFRVDTGSHYNEFNTMEEAKAFAEKQYGRESKSESKPADVEKMSIKELKAQRDKLKSGSGKENDAQYKKINDALTKKRLQTLTVGSEVKAHGTPLKITKINPDTNTIYGEFEHKGEKMQTRIGLEDIDNYDDILDSAPRVLTGDTRIRVRK